MGTKKKVTCGRNVSRADKQKEHGKTYGNSTIFNPSGTVFSPLVADLQLVDPQLPLLLQLVLRQHLHRSFSSYQNFESFLWSSCCYGDDDADDDDDVYGAVFCGKDESYSDT